MYLCGMPAAPAVVLLSGGLDSATTLAIARAEGFACRALSFRYGQRHAHELTCAQAVARHLGAVEHRVIDIDLRAFGGSALTSDLAVPKDRDATARATGIPITYVPARNTIFLSYALGLGRGARRGRHLHRRQRGRLQRLSRLPPGVHRGLRAAGQPGHAGGVEGRRITIHDAAHRPDQGARSSRAGSNSGVDYALTQSCYDPVTGRSRVRPLRLLPPPPRGLPRRARTRTDTGALPRPT